MILVPVERFSISSQRLVELKLLRTLPVKVVFMWLVTNWETLRRDVSWILKIDCERSKAFIEIHCESGIYIFIRVIELIYAVSVFGEIYLHICKLFMFSWNENYFIYQIYQNNIISPVEILESLEVFFVFFAIRFHIFVLIEHTYVANYNICGD